MNKYNNVRNFCGLKITEKGIYCCYIKTTQVGNKEECVL